MGLRTVSEAQSNARFQAEVSGSKVYTAPANKDSRILYQGLTQAALQSMPLGQFSSNAAEHIQNVKAAVDELAAFILERAK